MSNCESKISRKRKAENQPDLEHFEEKEVEVFLKIFVELAIKEPEELDKILENSNDKTDGVVLDSKILAVNKLRELLKADIDSLNLPHALKFSIKLLKTFLDFLNQSKLLKTLKDASNKQRSNKKRKTIEGSCTDVTKRSIVHCLEQKKILDRLSYLDLY